MAIPDKVAAANKINEFLTGVVNHGGLRLKYRITVDPPLPEERDWERPEILVDFAGPDSGLLLERGGELLRALTAVLVECASPRANAQAGAPTPTEIKLAGSDGSTHTVPMDQVRSVEYADTPAAVASTPTRPRPGHADQRGLPGHLGAAA